MALSDRGDVAIVLSGCGTSGRLAFMTAVSLIDAHDYIVLLENVCLVVSSLVT